MLATSSPVFHDAALVPAKPSPLAPPPEALHLGDDFNPEPLKGPPPAAWWLLALTTAALAPLFLALALAARLP